MSYNTHIDILREEKESVSCSFVKIFHIFSSNDIVYVQRYIYGPHTIYISTYIAKLVNYEL